MSAIDAATPSASSPSAIQGVEASEAFRADVLRGLSERPKRIPSKHLYDKRGSELFDQICELDEYYVTRCELEIMRRHASEMAACFGGPVRLVEFGSGSSLKTRLLLDHLDPNSTYLPVDVSHQHLVESCQTLSGEYPGLEISPICADFTEPLELPEDENPRRRTVVYFPGSTIGNFEHHAAADLLRGISELCGPGGELLIGVDLRKDAQIIHAAYNDSRGVTARFTKNLLRRVNRELDANFDLAAFDYRANYHQGHGRIEASLVSRERQRVCVEGRPIEFERGESIHTEYSHKYSIPQFHELAALAGFRPRAQWTDRRGYFAVLLLQMAD